MNRLFFSLVFWVFTLSGVPATTIGLVLTEPVRGKAVRLLVAVFDPDTGAPLDVRHRWSGVLDAMALEAGSPGWTVTVTAEHGAIDLIVANAENAAGGSGLTPDIYRELIAAGVDCITMGDHVYRRRDIFSILDKEHPSKEVASFLLQKAIDWESPAPMMIPSVRP